MSGATVRKCDLLTREGVQNKLKFKKDAFYKLVKDPTFPKAVAVLSEKRWIEKEIDEWISSRERVNMLHSPIRAKKL